MFLLKKPMLNVDELIAHVKKRGITFNNISEECAKEYLEKNNNYFKLTSYRKNYIKRETQTGEDIYLNLDFAYLIELARIDVQLRHILLGMALDIEHSIKVKLIYQIEKATNEDGYSIVEDFLEYIKNSNISYLTKETIGRKSKNPYCGSLIQKYDKEIPIWVFVEIIEFGDLINLTDFVAKRLNQEPILDIKTLDKIRQLRNAAAHSNCIINDLNTTNNRKAPYYITDFARKCGVSRQVIRNKLSNIRILQITHLLFAYNEIVGKGATQKIRINELNVLFSKRMIENHEYFKQNSLITSTYEYLMKIIKFYYRE